MQKTKDLVRLIGEATRKCGTAAVQVLNRTRGYFENDALVATQMDHRLHELLEEQRRGRYENRCFIR